MIVIASLVSYLSHTLPNKAQKSPRSMRNHERISRSAKAAMFYGMSVRDRTIGARSRMRGAVAHAAVFTTARTLAMLTSNAPRMTVCARVPPSGRRILITSHASRRRRLAREGRVTRGEGMVQEFEGGRWFGTSGSCAVEGRWGIRKCK